MTASTSTLMAALVIVASGLAAYSNSLNGVLVFDDWPGLISNPFIRSLRTAFFAPPDSTLSGRPVVSLTFAANLLLAGGDTGPAFVRGAHAVNIGIHLAAALVLFGVLRRTLKCPPLIAGPGRFATLVAVVCAMLWVVHPVTTSAVTFVIQRAESLMGLMYLLAVYAAIRAWTGDPYARRAWTGLSVVCCGAGMGCKEVMVSAPLVVGLHDALFSEVASNSPSWRRALRDLWRSRWPVYCGLAATWLILVALVASNPRPRSVGFGVNGWSSWLYLKTQAVAIVHYFRLAVWPMPLSIDYTVPAAVSVLAVLPQVLFLCVLVAATVAGIASRAPWAFAGGWVFLILAPTSSILPVVTEVVAEHRMYLPLAGIVSLAVVALFTVGRQLAVGAIRRVSRPACGALLIVLVVLLAGSSIALTRQRNGEFSSEIGLWAAAVKHQPENSRAQGNLGAALLRQGRFSEAEGPLELSLALRPDDPDTLSNLGSALCGQGRCSEGIAHLERALALVPDFGEARFNLAEAYLQSGRALEARAAYRQVLRQAPDSVRTMKRLAALLSSDPHDDVRDGQLAVSVAERLLVATNGRDIDAFDLLAAAYAEAGRMAEAVRAGEIAAGLARKSERPDQTAQIEERLALYRSGRPYRRALRCP